MFKWLKRVVLTILIVFFLAIGVFFAIRNSQLIYIDLIFWQGPQLSVALYIILSFSFGACVALLISSVSYLRSEHQVRALNKRLSKAHQELEILLKASITQELSVGKE